MPLFTHRPAPVLQPVACSSNSGGGSGSRATAAGALLPRFLRRQDGRGHVRTFHLRAAGGGDAQTAQRGLDVLESYWQQTGAEPSPAAAADLAQRANMSVEQVQRWFGRRTTAKRVTPPLPTVAAAPAAPPPEILAPERKVPPDRAARQLWETNARVDLEELRALNDSVEWRNMTPAAIEAVKSSMQNRKQEWLVLDGKPVPGAKEAVHEGPWDEGNPALGWASVPDTADLPRYVDGSALEWANINTKGANEQGFLDVDIEPPQSVDGEEPIILRWDDLDMPEDDGDVVVFRRNWEAEGRTPLKDIQVGDTLTGEVVFRHLYHGAVVDVGAEFDGLIMVMENDWLAVREHLALETMVTVRVTAIRKAHRFRFPLELECVKPAIGHLLRTPLPKERPIIIYADEDIEEAAMDAGRVIPPPPDYEGMLRAVRAEVAASFLIDDEANKGKGKRAGTRAAVEATATAADDDDDDDADGLAGA